MNNKFNDKIVGIGTTPMFLNGVPFYIRLDVTSVRNEVRPQQTFVFADKHLGKTKEDEDEDSIEIELLAKICEDQDSLIQEQATQICELQNRLADYEQELYDTARERLISERTSCMEGMA